MKISKEQLLKALEKVKPGLANKEQITQSTSFAFIRGRIITYNDELSISHPVPGLKIRGAILADNLYKFLGKVKKDDIDVSFEENEILLSSGSTKAGFTLQTEIKLPLDEELSEKGEWKLLPANFLKAVSFVMTACSRNMAEPILTTVHVNKNGFTEGSDGYKIARYDIGENMPIRTFLLPAKSAVEMVKLNPVEVTEGRGWVHFKTEEETIISCRILNEDKYVNTTALLESEKGIRISLPEGIDEMLSRAMVFSKREHILDESVRLTIENGKFYMYARSDSGWFEEAADIEYKGIGIQIDITPYLLKGILVETGGFECMKDKIKFEGEQWKYIARLRRYKTKKG